MAQRRAGVNQRTMGRYSHMQASYTHPTKGIPTRDEHLCLSSNKITVQDDDECWQRANFGTPSRITGRDGDSRREGQPSRYFLKTALLRRMVSEHYDDTN